MAASAAQAYAQSRTSPEELKSDLKQLRADIENAPKTGTSMRIIYGTMDRISEKYRGTKAATEINELKRLLQYQRQRQGKPLTTDVVLASFDEKFRNYGFAASVPRKGAAQARNDFLKLRADIENAPETKTTLAQIYGMMDRLSGQYRGTNAASDLQELKKELQYMRKRSLGALTTDIVLTRFDIMFAKDYDYSALAPGAAKKTATGRKVESLEAVAEKEKNSDLRKAFFSAEKGEVQPTESLPIADLQKRFAGAETKADVKAVLMNIGFKEGDAKFFSDKVFEAKSMPGEEPPVLQLLKTMNQFSDLKAANDRLKRLYLVKDEASLNLVIADMKKLEKGTKERALSNFSIAKTYGNIEDIARRMEVPTAKGDDETDVLIRMLNYMDKWGVCKSIKEYETKHMTGALDNLDIVGKYAYLRHTYPQLLKTYGDTFAFANYLRTQNLPSQMTYVVFQETLPRMIKGNSMDEIQTMLSMMAASSISLISSGQWNTEYKTYVFATKFSGMVDKANAAFFRRWMNYALENPDATNPATKNTTKPADAMKQKTPIRVTEEEIKRFLADYAPTLKRQFDQLPNVESVKDPETTVKIFRSLMNGQNLSVIDVNRPYMDLGIKTDQSLFSRFLNEEYPREAMPEIYTMEKYFGNGTYSYRNDGIGKSVSGAVTLERDIWGPSARVAVYAGLSQSGDSTQYNAGSAGTHLNRFGDYDVNYLLNFMASDTVNAEVKADLDAFKDTSNTFVHLYLRDGKDKENQYEMTVYRKDGSTYKQVQAYKLSSEQAMNIFAGYLDSNKDARALFGPDGKGKVGLKGLLVGYELSNYGLGFIKSDTTLNQMSELLSISSPERKVGARVYTDADGAKQLGMRMESKKLFVDAAGGKEDSKTVYGLNFKLKTEKFVVPAIALKHLDQIIAGGVSTENGYFLADYTDDLHGKKETGVTAGIRFVDKATGKVEKSANIWWFANGRAANYAYSADLGVNAYGDALTVTFEGLLKERQNLLDAMAKGDAKTVSDKLIYVNERIDSLKAIIGEKVTRAFKGTIGNKTLEYVAGDSQFFNMVVYGQKNSWNVNGSIGKVKSAEFNKVRMVDAENAAATLMGAAFLSTDDIAAVTGRYGRSSDPNRPSGSGWITEIKGGKNVAEASAGYYMWNEPYEDLRREYSTIIGTAGRSQKNLDKVALGYGKTLIDLSEGDNFSRTYYVIVEGLKTSTPDVVANVVKALALEAGLRLSHVQVDKIETLQGGLKLVKLIGYDAKGKGVYLEATVNGQIARPIY